jgi:hypothetical protein
MSTQFDYDVFISHSSKDKPVVLELANRLKQDGLRVWLDEWEIQPGDMIGLKIQQGLERSRTLFMVMSHAYFASEWSTLEHHTLLFRDPTNAQRRFIPLLIEDCKLPDVIAQFAYVDWRQKSEEAYTKLLVACRPVTESSTESLKEHEKEVSHRMEELRDKMGMVSDLPNTLIKSISAFLSDSTVAMFGHDKSNKAIPGLYGSGTLVVINSVYGILTAKHVWDNFIQNRNLSKISFSVVGYPHYIHEEISHLRPYFPDTSIDICLIQLPQPILGTIKSFRTFYPIERSNSPELEKISQYLWISTGFPYEWQPKTKKLAVPLFYYTHLSNYLSHSDGWDEIELQVDYNNASSNFPQSLEGVSGGGIWNFRVFYSDDSGVVKYRIEENSKHSLLVGVNFWQSDLKNGKRYIRGVGPNSIYRELTKIINQNP